MSAPPHANTWDEVPPDVQEKVRFLYGALVDGALEVDRSPQPGEIDYAGRCAAGLFQWEHVPNRMKTAMANMLMAQRHELVRTLTSMFQEILVDKVRGR